MGKYWREMSPEQQEKYLDLFKVYALNLYKGFPLNFEDRLSFEIVGSENIGDDAVVVAAIKLKADNVNEVNIDVNFRLHDNGGKLMFRDIKVGENSMIMVYRQRFQEMINEADEDINWFLEDFEMIANSTQEANEF